MNTLKIITVAAVLFLSGCASIEKFNTSYEITHGITYVNDYDQLTYGGDYWQTPTETRQLGTGDCDDFAVLIYFALLEKGESPVFVFGAKPFSKERHLWVESDGYSYSNNQVMKGNLTGFYVYERYTHENPSYHLKKTLSRMKIDI